MDIAASIECVASKMDEETAGNLRGRICSILGRARPPKPNLQKDEQASLKTLREDRNITILPADKGNATVIMDTAKYEKKIEDLLDDPIYKKVKKDPTPATERKVLGVIRELEKKDLIPRNLAARLKPSASKPPKLYGLPKTRKKDV